jgi:hypothetical protein
MSRAWVKLGWVVVACLLVASVPAGAFQTGSPDSQSASDKSKSAKPQSSTPSPADIAAAKASGKVWVNLDSGVYHKSGRWYGKTKNGKFMTADEAKRAGFKAAKRE